MNLRKHKHSACQLVEPDFYFDYLPNTVFSSGFSRLCDKKSDKIYVVQE
jgi:hypothetical protein